MQLTEGEHHRRRRARARVSGILILVQAGVGAGTTWDMVHPGAGLGQKMVVTEVGEWTVCGAAGVNSVLLHPQRVMNYAGS